MFLRVGFPAPEVGVDTVPLLEDGAVDPARRAATEGGGVECVACPPTDPIAASACNSANLLAAIASSWTTARFKEALRGNASGSGAGRFSTGVANRKSGLGVGGVPSR